MSRRLEKALRFYGQGFGLGRSEFMPGTWGTLPALPIAWLIQSNATLAILGYILLMIVSYYAARSLGELLGDSDHKSIVCDEIIGILPVLIITPLTSWIIVFWVFRLFDIMKPWPIAWADSKVGGAIGCILDDVLAGIFTLLFLLALNSLPLGLVVPLL